MFTYIHGMIFVWVTVFNVARGAAAAMNKLMHAYIHSMRSFSETESPTWGGCNQNSVCIYVCIYVCIRAVFFWFMKLSVASGTKTATRFWYACTCTCARALYEPRCSTRHARADQSSFPQAKCSFWDMNKKLLLHCACMYAHAHTHTHVCIYIYMCICVYVHVCVSTCIRTQQGFDTWSNRRALHYVCMWTQTPHTHIL